MNTSFAVIYSSLIYIFKIEDFYLESIVTADTAIIILKMRFLLFKFYSFFK